MELIEAINGKLGSPVDIIDVYHAPEPILGAALKGQRLLDDNTTYARLLTRHLLNSTDLSPLQQEY